MIDISSLLAGAAYAVLGSVVYLLGYYLIDWLRSEGAVHTGKYEQKIPAQHEEPEKRDEVSCRQVGSKLSGTIRRIQPTDQNHKRWKFEGRTAESAVLLTFWSTDPVRNPGSNGTIMLRVLPTSLDGHYVKSVQKRTGRVEVPYLVDYNLSWTKIPHKPLLSWRGDRP